MPAPDSIRQLVARFTDQREIYRSGKYNETQLRNDFLDPFFEALGWDVNNRKNYSEKFREVVKEASLDVDGTAKAADYAFQSGGHVHFFLEAKKPAVNIESHPESAFQIRRYGWSAKLNVSILSDFEQLAVYDCRQKPVHGDPAYTSRVNLYSFTEYIDKWDEIAALISYEAVHQGSLEKFADSLKGKRGTADVDDAFLAEMEHWREELARVIALRNNLSQRQINTAVQLIIDRIIFLRICEDRGIEPENALRDATDGIDVYGDLMELFKKADKKYNSGLFHFETEKGQSSHPDTLTPTLKIDDKVFKDILANLYLPKSPYAFNYFSAEILGQVYERFLGKVIRLTAGGHAKVEEKPEVRKAGGVYYTPAYIVEYIVKNTVGELLKDKTPADLQADPIRIVDPACGSGSFLLGVYQYLLDWSLNWFMANDPAKWAKGKNPPIFEADQGWQLTMEKKKELLTSHIFGVDIDSQAVEVTKLSLLLKVVENPGQLDLFGERILPDLGENIKCGNSLIGPDYYDNQQLTMFDTEEQYRVNAFDWHRSFPQAFAKGGFDAVIGNPPYVRQETLGNDKLYYQKHYKVYAGTADLYSYFIEKGVSLLSPSGVFSYIVANKWMRANYGVALRNWLKSKGLKEIVDFGDLPVFENATTYPCIIIVKNDHKTNDIQVTKVNSLYDKNIELVIRENSFILDKSLLPESSWSLFENGKNSIIEKLKERSISLWEYSQGKIYIGLKTGLNEAFIIDVETKNKLISEDIRNATIIKPFLMGRDIKRYSPFVDRKFLIFFPKGWTNENKKRIGDAWKWFSNEYPSIAKFLINYKNAAEIRTDKGDYWWELRACDYYSEFEKNKIVYSEIADRGQFSLDVDAHYADMTNYILGSDSKFLLGLLNSKVITFFISNISSEIRGGYLRWKRQYVREIPIPNLDFSDPADVARHDRMVALVESMLNLHKLSAAAQLPDEKDRLARQIQHTDQQIDKLVYDLYNLTPAEIKIVEGTS